MAAKTKLLAVAELPTGASRCVDTTVGPVAVFHTESGFFALANECPHRGGPLSEGPLSGDAVACPWHQWKFDLKSGACVNIPGAKTKSFPVEESDGALWVTLD